MTCYSIRSIHDDTSVVVSRSVRCKDDLAALDEGVRRSVGHAVEVWQGERLVARVKQGNAALDSSDNRCL